MANNLFESYKGRLAIAEKVYTKTRNGEPMDKSRKILVAKCLDNVTKFLNEAMDSSNATQRSDLGNYKRFALNLTNVVLPSLIAPDLVLTQPMSSLYGYINYIQYMYGADKGDAKNGTVVNDPFRLGAVDTSYTSNRVVETVGSGVSEITPAWTPIVEDAFVTITVNAKEVEFDDTAVYTEDELATKTTKDVKIITSTGDVKFTDFSTGKITGLAEGDRVAYVYDNVIIPQNKVPTLRAEMRSMSLQAKARRIAIYYSQIAAFQAKTDYGFDLGDQLAEKAVAQLTYEIDTEVIELLKSTAGAPIADLVWSKTLPVGVSKTEHYEGFTEIVENARRYIYDRTKRFAPNYMVISSDVLPILTFIKGFTAAPVGTINGPYFAGTLNGLKVYVSPTFANGEFVVGVNGDDMMSSVAVYAPYMAIVPTSLLQYNDGGTTQGWSTMYDLRVIKNVLIVAGRIIP